MAVAMLIGNKTLSFSLFGPGATIPSVIISEFREAVSSMPVFPYGNRFTVICYFHARQYAGCMDGKKVRNERA